nr:putative peptidase [uncultured Mediterranean phage uvMED]
MTWKESFKTYAQEQTPNEACGLLAIIDGKETFWPCKNLAEGKHEFFMLDPDDWVECEDTGEVIGVIHSHPVGAAIASDADKASCEHIGFPYYIYSINQDHWTKIEPSGWKASSLIGRRFIWGKYDCWSIVTDWFKENKNIEIPYWKRPKTLKEFSENPEFEYALPKLNFKKQEKTDNLKTGDVLLFTGAKQKLSHVAVYIGDMMILNHNFKALSCRQQLNLNYQKALKGVYRYAA